MPQLFLVLKEMARISGVFSTTCMKYKIVICVHVCIYSSLQICCMVPNNQLYLFSSPSLIKWFTSPTQIPTHHTFFSMNYCCIVLVIFTESVDYWYCNFLTIDWSNLVCLYWQICIFLVQTTIHEFLCIFSLHYYELLKKN